MLRNDKIGISTKLNLKGLFNLAFYVTNLLKLDQT